VARGARLTPAAAPLPDWVALRARTHAGRTALEAPDAMLGYAALDAAVADAATGLRERGMIRGEPVAYLHEASARFAVLAHAIARAGGVGMPLNARLTPAEMAWQLRDAGARRVVADAPSRAAAQAAARHAGTEVVAAEELWGSSARGEEAERDPAAGGVDPATPHSVIYTSGTTGRPKGAVLTHGNFYWSAVGSALNLGVRADDRWLACMPLFHVGGLSTLLRSAIYGTTAVIHPRFDEQAVNRALREDGITLLSVVAAMLQRMFAAEASPCPASLRAVLLGGGPAPRPLLEAARDRGVPVLQTYGLTEAASQVTTLAPEEALRRLGSAGLPLAGTTLRVERDGQRAGAGEVGEILVAGPTVTPGYLGHSDATAEALREGWLHTGDLGFVDEDGSLTVVDRRDDLIVTGGENVYPAEVEEALLAHGGVVECAVVGLADAEWGQRVTAVVVARPGRGVSAALLDGFLRGRLAGYKLPRTYDLREEPLPRTASGKVQRHLLREALERSGAGRGQGRD